MDRRSLLTQARDFWRVIGSCETLTRASSSKIEAVTAHIEDVKAHIEDVKAHIEDATVLIAPAHHT